MIAPFGTKSPPRPFCRVRRKGISSVREWNPALCRKEKGKMSEYQCHPHPDAHLEARALPWPHSGWTTASLWATLWLSSRGILQKLCRTFRTRDFLRHIAGQPHVTISDFSAINGLLPSSSFQEARFWSPVWTAWFNASARISWKSRFQSRIERAIVDGEIERNLIALGQTHPLIESRKKVSPAVPRPNSPLDNIQSKNDSVKSPFPKSDFPHVDEDIRIFSWNIALLRRWNNKEIFQSRAVRPMTPPFQPWQPMAKVQLRFCAHVHRVGPVWGLFSTFVVGANWRIDIVVPIPGGSLLWEFVVVMCVWSGPLHGESNQITHWWNGRPDDRWDTKSKVCKNSVRVLGRWSVASGGTSRRVNCPGIGMWGEMWLSFRSSLPVQGHKFTISMQLPVRYSESAENCRLGPKEV